MTKFAVIDSVFRREIKPFGGCFEMIKQTQKFVWLIIPKREGETEERKVGISRVFFFCEKDMTEEIKVINKMVDENYKRHEDFVNKLIKSLSDNSKK